VAADSGRRWNSSRIADELAGLGRRVIQATVEKCRWHRFDSGMVDQNPHQGKLRRFAPTGERYRSLHQGKLMTAQRTGSVLSRQPGG